MNEATIKLKLTCIRYGAEGINFYEFESPDGELLPGAAPGAHIGLHLPNKMIRQYSLINHGERLSKYVVGVKRDPASRGGSKFMHENFVVGTVIDVDPPKNYFPLADAAPHSVLIGGGIGITPIYNMYTLLQQTGASFDFYYSCRNRAEALFLPNLKEEAKATLHFDEEAGQLFDLKAVVDAAPAGTHFYCCGPEPMLRAYQEATKHMPEEQVHLEFFSATPEATNTEGSFTVVLARTGLEVVVEDGKTILDALRELELEVPFSCETGVCGSCETAVIEGVPDHQDMILTDSEKSANTTMMICCSRSKTDRLVLDL